MSTVLLARRLAEGAAPFSVRAPTLLVDAVDTLGRVQVVSATTARFDFEGGSATLEIDRDVRHSMERHPDALYVADLRAGAEGFLHPFQPPRSIALDGRVPVRVHESLIETLAGARLAPGVDLCREKGLALRRPDPVAVVGQRTIAALSRDDGATVTWWLPTGDALELRVVTDGETGWLEVLSLIQVKEAFRANCGPNTLLWVQKGASLTITAAEESAPVALMEPFCPSRPALFEAWARYAVLDREERDDRERARTARPLTFSNARQKGRNWLVDASVDVETEGAWIGLDADERRPVRLDQTVEAFSGELSLGTYTADTAELRAPGLVQVVLKPDRESKALPEAGRLECRTNKGEKVRLERERAALDRLTAGRASNERLIAGLLNPEGAPGATERPLPLPPLELLDASQLRAVRLIVGCESIVAIQGPPGTGKTRVIVEALRQIEAAATGERVRVLVSSVQNEAVGNVVERMAHSDGMMIRVVRRDAKNEDEAFDYAQWLDRQRIAVVERLEKMYKDTALDTQLASLRDAEDEVNEIRRWAGGGPASRKGLNAALMEASARKEGLLTSLLRDEAGRLAGMLGGTTAPPTPSEPAGAVAFPDSPDAVASWWESAAPKVPAAVSATAGAAVQRITAALAEAPSVRQERRLASAWAELKGMATSLAPPDVAPPPDPMDKVDAWAASALREIQVLRQGVEGSSQAIAIRFLRALKEDPSAWAAIVNRHAGAVAATCSMSARAELDPGESYDWVVIDEAGRASPFELLIPMVQGSRVVLIGDHRQLPPTVDEALARRSTDLDRPSADIRYDTLFGLLFRLLPPSARERLATQYRMHGEIGALVDQIFYRPHDESVASAFSGELAVERVVAWDVFGRRPCVWVDVAPIGEPCREENPREAEAVMVVLRKYRDAGATRGTEGPPIAVICPYTRQRERIRRAVERDPTLVDIVTVKTIDAVQGREYPVVVLCLVRTDGRPGFLASPNRLNVAISRAQRQLVVVGSSRRFLDSASVRTSAPELRQLVERLVAKHKENA